jgi:hypothetical protein
MERLPEGRLAPQQFHRPVVARLALPQHTQRTQHTRQQPRLGLEQLRRLPQQLQQAVQG